MKNVKWIFKVSILCSLFSFAAKAEEITIVTENFPSETDKIEENKVGGIAGEIITKALEAKNITYKMNWLPWKRSQQETQDNTDKKTFIIPLTRNKEREANYTWVAKLYDADTSFISYEGSKKINSFAEAKGKKIGVLSGSSYEGTIVDPKNGLNKAEIEAVPNDATNARKLEAGKIAGWYTGVIGGIAVINAEKMSIAKFGIGKKIDREENYLATAKSTPADLVAKVKSAIDAFKKTAQYKEIIKKYSGK
ncbi:substrate-binding periplasmic protein [Silvanigrella aquatica]|uniref:Solute-binding protein family 3/N-terminal domain-containing protein n=1 Tax=Silvanigrella aquatica TaxID=1915309 RepID=A0A1L4D0M2_9BACT|nr:ABC transporter substrate-binding protein [Silvanigrella aquatica]APJ03751.1 hypothetical protein AXG55_07460 [Silvanigrella aquatica]